MKAKHLDHWVPSIISWLLELSMKLQGVAETDWKSFEKFAVRFFVSKDSRLYWRENDEGHHCLYVEPERRMVILKGAHDANGHHGSYATWSFISKRFWWPELE